MSLEMLVALFGMAVATYATRVFGAWLAGRVALTGRLRAGLNALPGAVIVSLVAPTLTGGTIGDWVAAVATVAATIKTRSVLVAMLVGVGTVVAFRTLALG
jgi:uncharacterized membrane protein